MLKSGIYDFVICHGVTDMCFVLGFGRKRLDLKKYRISGLTDILNNRGTTGRVAKWNIELSPRDLQFRHLTSIKAQILPDLLVEWMEVQTLGPPNLSNSWKMFFDGSKKKQ